MHQARRKVMIQKTVFLEEFEQVVLIIFLSTI